MNTDLSVVVPVYNEEPCLRELHRRLVDVLTAIGPTYEIIYVDDGSRDRSLELLRNFAGTDTRTRYLSLTRNFGQGAALAAGLAASRGAAVVTIDADLQNPPEEIPRLLEKFHEGYEVVYGVRQNRRDPWLRRAGSATINRLLRLAMGTSVQPDVTAFCATHRRIIDAVNHCPERTRFHPVLCAWLGAKTAHVPVRHEPRGRGTSKYAYRPLLIRAMDLITGFTDLPLRLATWMGLGLALLGFGLAGWAVISKLTLGTTLLGWPSLMGAIGILGGAQLLAIGALGEYLGRAYAQLLGRPLYVVRESEDLIRTRRILHAAALPPHAVSPTRRVGHSAIEPARRATDAHRFT